MITGLYFASCTWCHEPTGAADTIPAPFPTSAEAIADAVEQGFTHDEATGRLLCPTCTEHAENLPADVAAELAAEPEPTAPGRWVFLAYFTTIAGYHFARRDCGYCQGRGLIDTGEPGERSDDDVSTCYCVICPPQAPATAPALLTDAHGHVVDVLVLAPADVETWAAERPLLVALPGFEPAIPTLAGRVALYEPQIDREPTGPLAPDELWTPHCAYCDVALLPDGGDRAVYPVRNGDADGQVCPAHPRTDRPRPHLAKWRVLHAVTGAMYVADPDNVDQTRQLREREHRAAALFPPITARP